MPNLNSYDFVLQDDMGNFDLIKKEKEFVNFDTADPQKK